MKQPKQAHRFPSENSFFGKPGLRFDIPTPPKSRMAVTITTVSKREKTMTPFTDEEAAVLVREAGAKLAETLGMQAEEDPTHRLYSGQSVLLVTDDRILLGEVVVDEGEMRTYRYKTYRLRATEFCDIYTEKRGITEFGWARTPDVAVLLPEGSVLYAGY